MSFHGSPSVSSSAPSSHGGASREAARIERIAEETAICEPWDDLEAAATEPAWAAWADGARGFTFLARGRVAALQGVGDARFVAVRESCSALVERLLGDRDALPFVVGGFAFAPRGRAEGHGDAHLFVPRELTLRRADGPVVRLTHRVEGALELGPPIAPRGRPEAAATEPLDWRAEPGEAAYRAQVAAATAAIARGEMAKVVLARRIRVDDLDRRLHPAATLRHLRARAGRATVFGFGLGDQVFLGATPETLAHVEGARLRTHAVAGTGDPRALLTSDKDLREHRHVVEDIVAALGPIARAVRAAPQPELLAAGHLTHLMTPIEADLDAHLLDAVAALHPTAALAGVPRAAAAAFLAQAEIGDRGWFGAPVGWMAPNGDGVFAVAIRSALLGPRRAEAWAGAGIVAGSDPAAEWAETEQKLRTVTSALRVEAP